jgi:hypothetical protein
MKLVEIVKRTIAVAALAAAAAGCTYLGSIPDEKIQSVDSTRPDAEWAEKYKGKFFKACVEMSEHEGFEKMTPEELVQKINTPFEAEIYLFWLFSRNEGKRSNALWTTSLPITHYNAAYGDKQNDCSEAAVAVAALLKDNGYKPYILRMDKRGFLIFRAQHEAFLFKKKGKFYALDNLCMQRDYREGFNTVNDLVKHQFLGGYVKYSVYKISKYFQDWDTTNKNMLIWASSTERVK